MVKVHTELDLGDRRLPVRAHVNRRAKRLILRVDSIQGVVHLTIPSRRALPEAITFATERKEWILRELHHGPEARPFVDGMSCPYRGVRHIIIADPNPRGRVQIEQDRELGPILRVGGGADHMNRRLIEWLKRQVRCELIGLCDDYCQRLGVKRGSVRITDTRTRWGSCSHTGTLSFNWRLILAPKHILSYVAAHECAHLVYMNHSPAYWRLLATLDVDAGQARDWFSQNGHDLFAYGVEASDCKEAA